MEDLTCSNPDCQISENGSCLQGLEPVESCPSFGKTVDAEDESLEDENDTTEEEQIQLVQLSSGRAYALSDLDTFLLRQPAQLVAIVGDTLSGKSTLICALYEKFLRGEFESFSFAGSDTLIAFEEVAHYSRAVSGASMPETQRTSLSEELQFFHLAIVSEDTDAIRKELFISDRAGEIYRAGLDRPGELLTLQELRLSRCVAVLVDGERLIQADEQHQVLDTTRQLVRAMIDSGTLSTSQHLQIILTKRDEVERTGTAECFINRVETLTNRIDDDFGSAVASVEFYEIAARDPTREFDSAHGCEALLKSWLNASEPSPRDINADKKVETQFDLLTLNHKYGAAL